MTSGLDHSPFSSPFTGSGPRVGVVLSHGFTGSPHGLGAGRADAAPASGSAVRVRASAEVTRAGSGRTGICCS